MPHLRSRAVRSSLVLAAAAAVAATTFGCAAFDPNPGVLRSAAAGPANTSPAGTPAGASTSPGSLSPRLDGLASVGRQVMANAQVRVFNAATNRSVPLIAAGGRNYGLRQVGATTDAKGAFGFQMPVPQVGDVFRVVVSDGKRSVTTLIAALRGPGDGAVRFSTISRLGEGPGGAASEGFAFAVNPATTLADNSVKDLILLSQSLTDEAEGKLLDEVIDKSADFAAQLDKNFTAGELATLTEQVDPTNGKLPPKLLGDAMSKAGLERVFKQTVAESLKVLSDLRQVASNVDTTVEAPLRTQDLDVLSEAGFKVDLAGTSISIEGNGVDFSFIVPDAVEPPPDSTLPPDLPPADLPITVEDEDVEANVARPGVPLGTDPDTFNPQVRMTHADGALTLQVTQGAGQQDVDTIVARISKTLTGASFSAPAIGQPLAVGSSTAIPAPGVHTIEAVGTEQASPVAVSQRMGGFSLTSPASVAHWKYNDTVIALVQVFDRPSHVYVTMSYRLNDAVTSNGGHQTVMNVASSVLALSAPTLAATEALPTGSVDIDIFSRAGNMMEFSEHIDAQ
ncbi:MAG: hypothetical protein VKQ33_14590 [Candidatus Sericytochromatia bacterium]|nr:hypothetical protein [Candidatus Sericytochromatia bacterium]